MEATGIEVCPQLQQIVEHALGPGSLHFHQQSTRPWVCVCVCAILHAITGPIDGEKTKTEVPEEILSIQAAPKPKRPLEHIQLKEEPEPSSPIISIPLLKYTQAAVDSLISLMRRVHASSLTHLKRNIHRCTLPVVHTLCSF